MGFTLLALTVPLTPSVHSPLLLTSSLLIDLSAEPNPYGRARCPEEIAREYGLVAVADLIAAHPWAPNCFEARLQARLTALPFIASHCVDNRILRSLLFVKLSSFVTCAGHGPRVAIPCLSLAQSDAVL